MQVLALGVKDHQSRTTVEDAIHMALGQKMGTQNVHRSTGSSRSLTLIYTGIIKLPKVMMAFRTLWRVTLRNSVVILSVEGDCSADGVAHYLSTFLRGRSEEIYEYLHIVKLLRVAEREGSLTFDEPTGSISFKSSIPKVSFVSKNKLCLYLLSKIRRSSEIFVEHVEELLLNYGLTGATLMGLETGGQDEDSLRLKRQLEAVWGLRRWYEQLRKIGGQQKRESNVDLAQQSESARKALSMLLSDRPKIIEQESNPLKAVEIFYRGEEKRLEVELSSRQEKKEEIVSAIFIQQAGHELLLSERGYSSVHQGVYRFILEDSVFHYDHETKRPKKTEEEMAMRKTLVRKSAKNGGDPGLLTEARVLIYLRNKGCMSIAKYYCNRCSRPFADGHIYMQHYPNTLSEKWLKQMAKVKVMRDIAKALLFLNRQNLLHRDLKETNIMVDREGRGRLIDFGSTVFTGQSPPFQPVDDKVRTTEGYFIPYGTFERELPGLAQLINRQDYYSHSGFDAYAFGVVLENQFHLGWFSGEGDPIRAALRWLSQVCRALNPDQRPGWTQIVVFLHHLELLAEEKLRFWRRRVVRYP